MNFLSNMNFMWQTSFMRAARSPTSLFMSTIVAAISSQSGSLRTAFRKSSLLNSPGVTDSHFSCNPLRASASQSAASIFEYGPYRYIACR